MGALRLLVADGNEVVRKGLCAFVREQPGWELAAEARDGREAVEIIERLEPELAILDTGMPLLKPLAEGHSSKQVAVALQIRPKTAETHRSNVMRRIDCHTTAGLVRYAIRNHIIEA